jgi:non-ribosomal peptide synthetase component F
MFLGRSAALPQAMLAILEAGAAYVPLDPAFPRDRLAFMIEDAQLRIIISRRSLVAELPPHAAQVICVDDELPVPPSDGVGTTADAGSSSTLRALPASPRVWKSSTGSSSISSAAWPALCESIRVTGCWP